MVDLTKTEQNLNNFSKHILSKLDKEIAELDEKSANTAHNKAFKKRFNL